MRRLLLTLSLLAACLTLNAQSTTDKQIAEQKRKIAALEQQINNNEKEIASLQKGRKNAQERAQKLTNQITTRNRMINETEKQEGILEREISRADSAARSLTAQLERTRQSYTLMAREAYRNYRHNNFLMYIFSSESFEQMTHRLSMLRSVADLRRSHLQNIESLTEKVSVERSALNRRSRELDSVKRNLTNQRARLQRDQEAARSTVTQLSKKEKAALKKKAAQEEQLSVAIDELRRLTKGNKEGSSFSAKTSNLRLPVEGGKVKRYNGHMAEILGQKGSRVISIYEGKVLQIKQNRITGNYDVYIAHGEYISTYANLSQVSIAEGASVKRNEAIGTIGSAVNINTMTNEYRMLFGIYAPSEQTILKAADFFRK